MLQLELKEMVDNGETLRFDDRTWDDPSSLLDWQMFDIRKEMLITILKSDDTLFTHTGSEFSTAVENLFAKYSSKPFREVKPSIKEVCQCGCNYISSSGDYDYYAEKVLTEPEHVQMFGAWSISINKWTYGLRRNMRLYPKDIIKLKEYFNIQ